jgi:L-ascorbate 6-phosphate lactonase
MPTLTWLGQSGFLIESAGERLLIDPFFSGNEARMYPPPPIDDFGSSIDRLLVTHEHMDHLDAEALPRIAARSPRLEVVAPAPILDMIEGAPAVGVRSGDNFAVAGGTVSVVPAIHAVHAADGYSDGGGRFVGYVLELDGVAIYHAGDTIVGDELLAALEPLRIDVALLPVNGRAYFREQDDLVGNLDVRDAVALAARIGATTLVPMHWDLFRPNRERAGATAEEAHATDAPVHVMTLARGVPWAVTGS